MLETFIMNLQNRDQGRTTYRYKQHLLLMPSRLLTQNFHMQLHRSWIFFLSEKIFYLTRIRLDDSLFSVGKSLMNDSITLDVVGVNKNVSLVFGFT